jgi:16S rRNA (cytosine967-C5)-methyltransferase
MLLGALVLQRGLSLAALAALCSGGRFAPDPLSNGEIAALEGRHLEAAPLPTQADVPAWLWPSFESAFGVSAVAEGQGLAARATLDLRVNTLKVGREKLLAALAPLGAAPTPLSPFGLRIAPRPDGRSVSVQSEPSFRKGWFEVQDEGSQVAALLAAARPGEQVLDLCAGAGGKTLALAASMANKGQIFATDGDRRRLAPIHERLARAGIRNVQVRTPRGGSAHEDLRGRMDLVVLDAPCSGTGTWRRNPDAKWRLRPASLERHVAIQRMLLASAAEAVRPGGRLCYVTCSVLREENDDAVTLFRSENPAFEAVAPGETAAAAGLAELAGMVSSSNAGLQLTPRRTGTDGFFVAVLRRRS